MARPGGDAIEADSTEGTEDLADGVAAAVRDAAGRQDEVGAHQLVLDRVAQATSLVGDGGDAEGFSAGVSNGRG